MRVTQAVFLDSLFASSQDEGMATQLLVTGASGQLGSYLLRELCRRGTPAAAWSGSRTGPLFGVPLRPVDLTDPNAIATAFRKDRPEVVIHTGALARVADCFHDPERAHRLNTEGSAVLAGLAGAAGARLVYVSTDLVFDGERGRYRENDVAAPVSVYGHTKLAAEETVRRVPRSLIVRVSLLFGPSLNGRPSFFDEQIAALRAGRPVMLFIDEWRTPLSLATAARALVELAHSDVTGVLHVGGPERLSRWEMGQRLADFLGADPSALVAAQRDQLPAPEARPRDTSLDSSGWRGLFPGSRWPTYAEALGELLLS
jgi:dTDP-4-dehydrorhamnose reductase